MLGIHLWLVYMVMGWLKIFDEYIYRNYNLLIHTCTSCKSARNQRYKYFFLLFLCRRRKSRHINKLKKWLSRKKKNSFPNAWHLIENDLCICAPCALILSLGLPYICFSSTRPSISISSIYWFTLQTTFLWTSTANSGLTFQR